VTGQRPGAPPARAVPSGAVRAPVAADVASVLLASEPILELALDLVERASCRDMGGLRDALDGWGVIDQELVLREPNVDAEVVPIGVTVRMTTASDHDVAGNDVVTERVELANALQKLRRKRVRMRHVPERELRRGLHEAFRCTFRAPSRQGLRRGRRAP